MRACCLSTANTTNWLQQLDLSFNKAAKDFLRDKFRQWYAKEVSQSVQNEPESRVVPVEMPAGIMKELRAKWLVAFNDYISIHPELVVNGFKEAGIVHALENGAVGSPQHNGTFLDDDQAEDPFLNIHMITLLTVTN